MNVNSRMHKGRLLRFRLAGTIESKRKVQEE